MTVAATRILLVRILSAHLMARATGILEPLSAKYLQRVILLSREGQVAQ